jgi:AcrR family transcriptional regulator
MTVMKTPDRAKALTVPARERLLDAAARLFAERGFNGVSVREIAAAAEVNLGVIPYYFGTKENLLQEVFQRLFSPVLAERRSRIKGIFEHCGDATPDIRELLRAALEPVFRQSRSNDTYRRLAGRSSTDPTPEVRRVIDKTYAPSSISVPVALRRACPHLSDTEFNWRYFCLHGAVQYVLADVGRIQAVVGKDFDTSNPEVALNYVIPFLAAGLLAPGVDSAVNGKTKPPRSRRGSTRAVRAKRS